MELVVEKIAQGLVSNSGEADLDASIYPFKEINTPAFLQDLRKGGVSSQKAFRKMVRILLPKLTQFLRRSIRSEAAIQDALQETFLGVHRGLNRFEGKCRLSTWVYSLAYRKACDFHAQEYRRKPFEMDQEPYTEIWEMPEVHELPIDELFYQTRLLKEILSLAQQLPKIYRDAYQLRDLDGLCGEDAAEILGISVTLIRVRLHRARILIVESIRKKTSSS